MNKRKSKQSSKHAKYYDAGFIRVERNKLRREKARKKRAMKLKDPARLIRLANARAIRKGERKSNRQRMEAEARKRIAKAKAQMEQSMASIAKPNEKPAAAVVA